MNELYAMIGRRLVDLKKKDELPKTAEQLLNDDEIAAAVTELASGEEEIRQLQTEIKNVAGDFSTAEKKTEDTAA